MSHTNTAAVVIDASDDSRHVYAELEDFTFADYLNNSSTVGRVLVTMGWRTLARDLDPEEDVAHDWVLCRADGRAPTLDQIQALAQVGSAYLGAKVAYTWSQCYPAEVPAPAVATLHRVKDLAA